MVPAFDHLVHLVPDVERAAESYRAVGLPATPHAGGAGVAQGGWRLDERYIELISWVDGDFEDHPLAAGIAVLGRAAARAGGAGPITFAVDVPDIDATADRLRAEGHEIEVVEFAAGDAGIGFTEVFVLDVEPWMPFFIRYDPPRAVFVPQIEPGLFDSGRHDLLGIVVETSDPAAGAAALGALLGIQPDGDSVPVPGATIWFEPGHRRAIVAAVLDGGPQDDVTIDGLTYRFAAN